jgi:hypothetical protein
MAALTIGRAMAAIVQRHHGDLVVGEALREVAVATGVIAVPVKHHHHPADVDRLVPLVMEPRPVRGLEELVEGRRGQLGLLLTAGHFIGSF